MSPSVYFTTAFGSCLTIALIFFNYLRGFNTDTYQRRLFLVLLCAAFVSVVAGLAGRLFEGLPGPGPRFLLYAAAALFLSAQSGAYYLSVVFIDYFAHKNAERSKKVIACTAVFLAAYTASVLANLPLGYYFSVSPDNYYVRGNLSQIGLFVNSLPAALVILDVLSAPGDFRRSQSYLIAIFLLISAAGVVMDIALKGGSLAWPCFTAAFLYLYFFILQSDSKIDVLTGIGNRYSFNEFISKLSRLNAKVDYSIVMIDMDKFKEINDTLGHLEGDKALRDVATIIKGCLRHSDFAARFGGDEFVVAVEAQHDIQRLMERITGAIDMQNEMRARPYQLYISYGYDIFTTNSGQSIHGFLAGIDEMMYRQKEERRTRGLPSAITSKLQD